ncbi:MAG: NUDIX hydrolase [Candidatus Roizmanbacteria bacterium]|nr:NUDIX hydrolase [Candidatus Roizmanbacteria bacterium]
MVLRDEDIFPNTVDVTDIVWKDRLTGKVVLFNNEGQVALIGNKVNDFFLLPGGGIEDNESVLGGIRRECKEETGCEIEIQEMLGMTEDFRSRDGRHCISYGYSAKVISNGTPTLTDNEEDIGAYVKWLSLPEAVELFRLQEQKVKAGEVKFYNTCFNILRDSLFIYKAQDLTRE